VPGPRAAKARSSVRSKWHGGAAALRFFAMHYSSHPSTAEAESLESPHAGQSDRLLSSTFIGLLLTQFLGATNDSILRWLVIGLGKDHTEYDHSTILAI
jgi:hypothetical protein